MQVRILGVAILGVSLLIGAITVFLWDTKKTPRVAWGVFPGNRPLNEFEMVVDDAPQLRSLFINWGEMPPSVSSYEATKEVTPVIFLETYDMSLDDINAGVGDEFIHSLADELSHRTTNVILAPFAEMNGNWDPWGGAVGSNSPQKIIQAWRRIHDGFAGAPNVRFAWVVNASSVPDTPENAIERYYPGDEYVDYVGVDGFNDGDPWLPFESIFGKALAQLARYPQPILITSMASAEGANKAGWIKNALCTQVPMNRKIQGWIWFDEHKERDWRIDSSPAALLAFRESVRACSS